jgi:predicted dehydrogenase
MTHGSNRRDFLKTSAAFGAGLWVVGSGSSLIARQANERVAVAFVGVGGRGGSNLDELAGAGADVVGLCDVDEGHLGEAASKHGDAKTFHDFRKMYDELDKSIDAVCVSTPDHTHTVAAVRAMRMGKHCYCEKPLTRTISEARLMAETARQHKVATQMGNQGHSDSEARRTVEIIKAGAIGAVKEVHAWTNRPIWPQGLPHAPTATPEVPGSVHWDLWVGPARMHTYSPEYHPFKWRGWWEFGTGALGDMACHILDVAFWSLDLRDPTTIEAECSGLNPYTAPQWSVIKYQFPERDGRPPVTLTWYDGGKRPPQELVEGEELREGGSLFIGEKGKIYIPDDYGRNRIFLPKDTFSSYQPPEPTLPRVEGHKQDFLAACKDPGRPAGSHFDYAAALTETVLIGNLAVLLGKPVEWDAKEMRVKNAAEADCYIRPEYRKGWEL